MTRIIPALVAAAIVTAVATVLAVLPPRARDVGAAETRTAVPTENVSFQQTFDPPAPQQQQAGPYTHTQLPGQKFRIRGTTGYKGVTFYGVAAGQGLADNAGRIDVILANPSIGQLNYLESDASRFNPQINPTFPHLVPQAGDGQGSIMLTNSAPSILGVAVSGTPGHYTITGTVADDTAESRDGLVVTYGFNGASGIVQPNGSFRIYFSYPRDYPRPLVGRLSVTDWYGLTTSVPLNLP